MIRYIPRKTKVKMELLPHITVADVLIGVVCAAALLLVLSSNLPYKWTIGLAMLAFIILLYVPLADGERAYFTTVLLFRFFAFKKKYTKDGAKGTSKINELIPYEHIVDEKYIDS